MKTRLALPCAIVLAAGLAFAQEPPTSTTGTQDRDRSTMTGKTTKLVAEVVSTDNTANTITVRNAKSADQTSPTGATGPGAAGSAGSAGTIETVTLPVSGKAIASLKNVSAGDRVSLTCSGEAAGSGSAGMSGTTGTTGTAGTTGGDRTMGGEGHGKIQASCPAVTAIAKLKASSSQQ